MQLGNLKDAKRDAAEFMTGEITRICTEMPKRDPGSEGERVAAEYMASQLSEYGGEVKTELFKVNPGSFFGWIYITMTCLILGFVCYFFATMVTVLLVIVALVPMFLQFIFYTRALDPLYPEKTSANVTAVKKCAGEVKQRIFYNGHSDAVWEWRTNYRFGGTAFISQVVICMIGAAYLFIIAVARWASVGMIGAGIAEGAYLYAGLAGLVFVPFWFFTYFLSDTKTVVDGANDNLTGCYMGIAVLKALKDNGIELEHTEVGVIITGSEEAGLRGAKAWCEAHKGEYADVPTYIFSYDTIRDGKFLQINTRDLNSLVKCDKEACNIFSQAADKAGVKCGKGTVPFGATDCAAFNSGGFKSAGITALDHKLPKYYHTRLDSYNNLNEDCLAECFAASVEVLNVCESKYCPQSLNGTDCEQSNSDELQNPEKSPSSDEVQNEEEV